MSDASWYHYRQAQNQPTRTLLFTVSCWWNYLPNPIWDTKSLTILNKQLKTHLFRLKIKSSSMLSLYFHSKRCLKFVSLALLLFTAWLWWITCCIPHLQVALNKKSAKRINVNIYYIYFCIIFLLVFWSHTIACVRETDSYQYSVNEWGILILHYLNVCKHECWILSIMY